MKIKVGDTVGDFKHVPTTRPKGAVARSVMGLEATVDATPQPLRKLRRFAAACHSIPSSLKPEAQIVLQAIFSCFEKQKTVSEGLIGDLIWGFAQCGLADTLTFNGLRFLAEGGYVKFQAPDGSFVEITSDQASKAWVRYQEKLLKMVYEDSHANITLERHDTVG